MRPSRWLAVALITALLGLEVAFVTHGPVAPSHGGHAVLVTPGTTGETGAPAERDGIHRHCAVCLGLAHGKTAAALPSAAAPAAAHATARLALPPESRHAQREAPRAVADPRAPPTSLA